MVSKANSFPHKILSNSTGQFTKFRLSPWQNHPNSAAYHALSL